MRRRLVETLVLLGLVAVLVSVVRREQEGETRPSLRELTIDGLSPGMAVSEVDRQGLSPSTVFGTEGIHDGKRVVNFVYGDSLLNGNIPYVKNGDLKERVYEKLGRPDRVREQVWTYEGAFAVGFRDDRLRGIYSDESYLDQRQDYYITCQGWSDTMLPNYFYGLVGESRTGRSTLVQDPWLTLSTSRRFYSALSVDQVVLDTGRLSVGQSLETASEAISGREVATIDSRYAYDYADFTLTLEVKEKLVARIVVEPPPRIPEPNPASDCQGILDLIERHP